MKLLTVIFGVLLLCGCTDTQRAGIMSVGNKHKIEMYSGGTKIREWISTGVPHNETDSDGYLFKDSETKELIRVSGDVIITCLD